MMKRGICSSESVIKARGEAESIREYSLTKTIISACQEVFMRSNALVALILIILFALIATCVAYSEEKDRLITVFEDNANQFTGVAVSQNNRIFLSYPNWLEEHKYSVVEVLPDGKLKPFPDEQWNNWKKGEPGKEKFVCAQAVYVDNQDTLWVVDPASPEMAGTVEGAVKLVKINLKGDKVEHIYYFDEKIADKSSYLNDVRVDTRLQCAYLTDSATGAIIVVNLRNGTSRKFLEKHSSTLAHSSYVFRIDGKELSNAKGPVRIHSDGIALSPDGKFLYYKPLTDIKLYRIETKYFFDRKLKPAKLPDKVQSLGDVCTSDGLICDSKGNLYLGDIPYREIVKYKPDGTTEVLLKDDRLLWPDSYALSKDGWLYITCSQIHLMPWFNEGKNLRTTPYRLFKIKI